MEQQDQQEDQHSQEEPSKTLPAEDPANSDDDEGNKEESVALMPYNKLVKEKGFENEW